MLNKELKEKDECTQVHSGNSNCEANFLNFFQV